MIWLYSPATVDTPESCTLDVTFKFNIIDLYGMIMSTKSGPCKKCTTDIPLKAERCPQCGWEPGKPVLGGLGVVVGFVLMFGAIFQILVGVIVLFTPLVGVPFVSAALGAFLFVGAGSIQALIASWLGGFGTKYAAEQPDESGTEGEDSKAFMEEMREAQQHGEERGEKIRGKIDTFPDAIFTAGILAGVLLTVVALVVAGSESEIVGIPPEDLMAISMTVALIVMVFTILADIGRVNRVYDADHKWWIWGIGALIPFFGTIPALVWIWRRKSTTRDEGSSAAALPKSNI